MTATAGDTCSITGVPGSIAGKEAVAALVAAGKSSTVCVATFATRTTRPLANSAVPTAWGSKETAGARATQSFTNVYVARCWCWCHVFDHRSWCVTCILTGAGSSSTTAGAGPTKSMTGVADAGATYLISGDVVDVVLEFVVRAQKESAW